MTYPNGVDLLNYVYRPRFQGRPIKKADLPSERVLKIWIRLMSEIKRRRVQP